MQKNNFRSFSIKAITIFSFIFATIIGLLLFAKNANAACYCIDPIEDDCGCTRAASDVPEAIYPASFDGVDVLCTHPDEANSMFAVGDPICDSRFNNEIIPYCAHIQGEPHRVVCWGTGFTFDGPGNVPIDTIPNWVPWDRNEPVQFNSYVGDGNTTLIYTCWENNFCCSIDPDDYTCDPTGHPPVVSCSPDESGAGSSHAGACLAGPIAPPDAEIRGEGESRLWFSQTRLISALASIAQTMYNPQNLNSRYNTTAFSKNAPRSDTSGEITNSGALSTKVEQHQGLGVVEDHSDYTPVVDSTEGSRNNSSIIEGFLAPFPLFSFGNTEDENIYNDGSACYIPQAISYAGDDLMGPRIEGEMLLTQQFNYDVPPRPDGCVEDGEAYSRTTDPELEDCPCCSAADPSEGGLGEAACQPAGNPCRPTDESAIDCEPEPEEYLCVHQDSLNFYCCPESTTQCYTQETGICQSLPPVEIQTPRMEAQVFSKTPIIELVYETLIDGEDSLYKRFMPDFAPISEPDEKPTSSYYRANVTSNNPRGTGLSVGYGDGLAASPEIYFPHIGTLAENWLYRFQEALRPQGVGVDQPSPPGPPAPPLPPTSTDGYCAPSHIQNMEPAFTSNEALEASCICQSESSGTITALNDNCLLASDGINNDDDGPGCTDLDDIATNGCPPPYYDGAAGDYSVGLFQINLQPRATFTPRCDTAGFPGAFVDDPSMPVVWCEINDQTALDNCVEYYIDAANEGRANVEEAYSLYSSSGGWCPWSTAPGCGLCQ